MSVKRLATFVAGSTAVAATMAGLVITTAAPANAAPKFSAIAYSVMDGAWGWAMRATAPEQALNVATDHCEQSGGDCRDRVVSDPGGCVALVRSVETSIFAFGTGPSTAVAQDNAFAKIGGGEGLVSTCSGGDNEAGEPIGAGGVSPLPAPPPPPPVVDPIPDEVPPTDAIRLSFDRGFFTWTANVTSTADIPGKCTYVATNALDPKLPGVNEAFDIGPKGSASLSVLPPPTTYHVEVRCSGPFKGQTVEFGRVNVDVP